MAFILIPSCLHFVGWSLDLRINFVRVSSFGVRASAVLFGANEARARRKSAWAAGATAMQADGVRRCIDNNN